MARARAGPQRPPRIFYGWIVVAGLSVAAGVIAGMAGGNVGLFVKPMTEELGMGQTSFGWAMTARLLAFGIASPFVGRAIDRYGARAPLALAGLVVGLAVAGLGFINAGWQMVGLFGLIGLVGFWGSHTLYVSVPAARWFIRRRGRAMAVVYVGTPIGIGMSVPLTQLLIGLVEWRAAWVTLGGVGGALVVLLALVVIRSRPEDMGLVPDGASLGEEAAPAPASLNAAKRESEYAWTRAEAMRTGAFWRLALVFGTVMFGAGSIFLFRVPYFMDQGIDPLLVAWAVSLSEVVQVGCAGVLLFLVDRSQPRHIGAGAFVIFIGALLLLMVTTNAWQMFLASLLLGIGFGSLMFLQVATWPLYFGRQHLGAIRGMAMPVTQVLSALGFTMPGMVFDATGTYWIAWWTAVAVLVVGGFLLLATPRPMAPGASPGGIGP